MISSNILTRNIGSELSTLFLTLKKKISNFGLMAMDRMVVWCGFFFIFNFSSNVEGNFLPLMVCLFKKYFVTHTFFNWANLWFLSFILLSCGLHDWFRFIDYTDYFRINLTLSQSIDFFKVLVNLVCLGFSQKTLISISIKFSFLV